MSRGRLLLAAGAGIVVAAALAVVLALAATSSSEEALLPDLDAEAPGAISGRTSSGPNGPRFLLGFASAAGNVGEGPLIIVGSRRSRRQSQMQVVQQVAHADGSTRNARVAATLRYVRSADHEHWHLLDFMQYELRRSNGTLVAPDRKTGFCLGDRYALQVDLARADPEPRYTQECGKGRRDLRRLVEGISVGYGDDYDPHLEGQNFDITGLPAGRYLLVHRVNSTRALRESDYSNNTSSMALALSWPNGTTNPPRATVIRRCPDSATCS